MSSKVKYQRILLKLSGEALAGDKQFGINPDIMKRIGEEIREIHAMGIEGFILSWLDYLPELEYFGERVMPLLKQAGLRL